MADANYFGHSAIFERDSGWQKWQFGIHRKHAKSKGYQTKILATLWFSMFSMEDFFSFRNRYEYRCSRLVLKKRRGRVRGCSDFSVQLFVTGSLESYYKIYYQEEEHQRINSFGKTYRYNPPLPRWCWAPSRCTSRHRRPRRRDCSGPRHTCCGWRCRSGLGRGDRAIQGDSSCRDVGSVITIRHISSCITIPWKLEKRELSLVSNCTLLSVKWL